MLGVERNFLAPATLNEVLEADDSLLPCAGCRELGEMHVVVFDIGDFNMHFMGAALVPIGKAAEMSVGFVRCDLHAPAYVRIVFVIASVERVVDLQSVVGTVVDAARDDVFFFVQRSRDDGCTAVVVIVVGVPVITNFAQVVAVFKVIDQSAETCRHGNRAFCRERRRVNHSG